MLLICFSRGFPWLIYLLRFLESLINSWIWSTSNCNNFSNMKIKNCKSRVSTKHLLSQLLLKCIQWLTQISLILINRNKYSKDVKSLYYRLNYNPHLFNLLILPYPKYLVVNVNWVNFWKMSILGIICESGVQKCKKEINLVL